MTSLCHYASSISRSTNASVPLIGSTCPNIRGKTLLTSTSITAGRPRGHAQASSGLPLLPVLMGFSTSEQLQCDECEGECDTFSSRLDFPSFPHVIHHSGNLFCQMLRTSNEEMKHGGTMTDQSQREPCRGEEHHGELVTEHKDELH